MDSQPGRRQGGAVVAIAIAILLPILYVLSVGPAVMFVEMTGTEQELGPVLGVVYYPVVWLYANTWLKEPLEAYVGFWRDWW